MGHIMLWLRVCHVLQVPSPIYAGLRCQLSQQLGPQQHSDNTQAQHTQQQQQIHVLEATIGQQPAAAAAVGKGARCLRRRCMLRSGTRITMLCGMNMHGRARPILTLGTGWT